MHFPVGRLDIRSINTPSLSSGIENCYVAINIVRGADSITSSPQRWVDVHFLNHNRQKVYLTHTIVKLTF